MTALSISVYADSVYVSNSTLLPKIPPFLNTNIVNLKGKLLVMRLKIENDTDNWRRGDWGGVTWRWEGGRRSRAWCMRRRHDARPAGAATPPHNADIVHSVPHHSRPERLRRLSPRETRTETLRHICSPCYLATGMYIGVDQVKRCRGFSPLVTVPSFWNEWLV